MSRKSEFERMKEIVLQAFIDSCYAESDRIHVVMHDEVDTWAAELTLKEALEYLSEFDTEDFRTLDRGLYEDSLQTGGFDGLSRVLCYCIMEQELLNDELINSLQGWDMEQNKSESEELMDKVVKEIADMEVVE